MRIFDWDSRSPWRDDWACLDCGRNHRVPNVAELMVCPAWPLDRAQSEVDDYIGFRLAQSCGQYPAIRLNILYTLGTEMVRWQGRGIQWGADVCRSHLNTPGLGDALRAAMRDPLDDLPAGHNSHSRFNDDDREQIIRYLPLIRSYAASRATSIVNARGDTWMDEGTFAQLEALGLRVLEDELRKCDDDGNRIFDPTQGVTFGAYVKKRLAGEMDNWLTRKRIRTVPFNDLGPSKSLAEAVTGTRRQAMGPASATHPANEPAGGVRLLRGGETVGDSIKAALATLNPKQRIVWEGRECCDPPRTRPDLARELGIADPTQISRIHTQAKLKITKFLTAKTNTRKNSVAA